MPLALENIAALVSWPGEEMSEGRFLAELVERTGVRLLIDVANLHTNHVNRGEDPARALSELPVEAIAYVHVAGGVERDGVWHDTHAHPVPRAVLDVLADLASRVAPPGVLLERDDDFPAAEELADELRAIRMTAAAAAGIRSAGAARVGTAHQHGAPFSRPAPEAPLLIGAGARVSGGFMPGGARDVPDAPLAVPETAPAPQPGARQRVAVAQAALLSALVAGTPVPEGFDSRRLGVQSRALAAKRAGVVAKVAPELPEILGKGYRPAFLAYARYRPMTGGYRRDALDFAEHLLVAGRPEDPAARRRLTEWWQDRSGSRPPGRATRLVRAARHALVRR